MANDDNRADETIKLTHVPVSFVDVFRAKAFGQKRGSANSNSSDDGGSPSFRLNALIPKNTAAGKAMDDRILDAIDNAKAKKWPGASLPKIKDDRLCYHDGDDMDYEGYADHWYLAARNRNRPKVIDADGKTPLVESDGRPYSGSICNVWVRVWGQEYEGVKRVNCSLEAVQFVRDGERFGGPAPIPDEEFQDERDPADRRSRGRDDDDGDRRSSRSRDDDSRSERGRSDERRSSHDRDESVGERPRRRREV